MRDSFVFYRSFADAIAGLPSEEYKKVIKRISEHIWINSRMYGKAG